MAETIKDQQNARVSEPPVLHVAPSPHLSSAAMTTQGMMRDVLIALVPVILVALYNFHGLALFQIVVCVASCLVAEALFVKMRDRTVSLKDCSAAVTGVILALSLPATAPWYVGPIAGCVAIGIGKVIFGGVGMNLFNPAMVGRAFVMISFAGVLAASGYENSFSHVDAISQATPMDAFKQSGVVTPLVTLFLGTTNGSLGETSALACLLGGLFLCIRRTASWEIPAGVLAAVLVIGGLQQLAAPATGWTVLHHLFGGRCFLAPSSSPPIRSPAR